MLIYRIVPIKFGYGRSFVRKRALANVHKVPKCIEIHRESINYKKQFVLKELMIHEVNMFAPDMSPRIYWDIWEELNSTISNLSKKDPLDEWCELYEPWSDECRIYDV